MAVQTRSKSSSTPKHQEKKSKSQGKESKSEYGSDIMAIISGICASLASLFSKLAMATNQSLLWIGGVVLSNLIMWWTFTFALEKSPSSIRFFYSPVD